MSAPAAAPPAVADGYRRLRAGQPVAVRGRAHLIWVEGPDAGSFLHGLLSADVAGLSPGEARLGLILDAKGHVQADMRVHRDSDDAFTIVVVPGLADLLMSLLERYHFSEELDVLGPEEVETVTVAGLAAPPAGLAQIVVPGAVPGTLEMAVDSADAAIAALDVPEAPAESLEMARIAGGVPRVGVDTGPTTLVQEAALEDVAVSFDKGCYLGQETVARVKYRGRTNRRLRGLLLGHPAPATGAAVTSGGREVGRLTSVALTPDLGAIGLAVLRHEVTPGGDVTVEGAPDPARVVELPFRGA